MADIFISYASEDRKRAQVLVLALEQLGWSVFWDLTVPAGLTWDEYIGSKLEEARCVVVAWSESAVKSRYVREEAREGRDQETLIPVLFEKVKPPFGFGGLHAVDLISWNGGESAATFQELVKGIERVLGTAPRRAEVGERPTAAKKPASAKRAVAEPRATVKKKKTAKKTTAKKTASRKAAAARRPTLTTGEEVPTWDEDEVFGRDFQPADPMTLFPGRWQLAPASSGLTETRTQVELRPNGQVVGTVHIGGGGAWGDPTRGAAMSRMLNMNPPVRGKWTYDGVTEILQIDITHEFAGQAKHEVVQIRTTGKESGQLRGHDLMGNVWIAQRLA